MDFHLQKTRNISVGVSQVCGATTEWHLWSLYPEVLCTNCRLYKKKNDKVVVLHLSWLSWNFQKPFGHCTPSLPLNNLLLGLGPIITKRAYTQSVQGQRECTSKALQWLRLQHARSTMDLPPLLLSSWREFIRKFNWNVHRQRAVVSALRSQAASSPWRAIGVLGTLVNRTLCSCKYFPWEIPKSIAYLHGGETLTVLLSCVQLFGTPRLNRYSSFKTVIPWSLPRCLK